MSNTQPTFSGNTPTSHQAGYRLIAVDSLDRSVLVSSLPDAGLRVTRLNEDGSVDSSFGQNGVLTLKFDGLSYGNPQSVLITTNDDILVVGDVRTAQTAQRPQIHLVQIKATGELDSSFGSNGVLTFETNDTAGNPVGGAVLDADGKILVATSHFKEEGSGTDLAVVRLNADGSIDTGFGDQGVASQSAVDRTLNESGKAVAVGPDGSIFIVGTDSDGLSVINLVKFTAGGLIDETDSWPTVLVKNAQGPNDLPSDLLVQPDGKVAVVGTTFNIYSVESTFLYKLGINGDTETLQTRNGGAVEIGTSVARLSTGELIVSGYVGGINTDTPDAVGIVDRVLLKYEADGTLDTDFGVDGVVYLNVGSNLEAGAIAIDSEDRIVVTGGDAVVRLLPNGTVDSSFVSDLPASTLGDLLVGYDEGSSEPVVLDSNVQLFDADLATIGHYGGSSLTLVRHGGANPDDAFSGAGVVERQATGEVNVNSTAIGTYAYEGGELTISFNELATQSLVDQTLQSLAYANSSERPSRVVQIDWVFNDGQDQALDVIGTSTIAQNNLVDQPISGELKIEGLLEQGQVIYASGVSDPDGTRVRSYEWYAGDDLVQRGDFFYPSLSYTLKQSDVGKIMSIKVTYQHIETTLSETLFEAQASTVVANVDDEATGRLSLLGIPEEGGQYSAYFTDLTDPDGATEISWQWQISPDGQTGWVNVAGSTSDTFSIASDQSMVGKYIRVQATTTDVLGGTTVFIGESSPEIRNRNDLPIGKPALAAEPKQGDTLVVDLSNVVDEDGIKAVTQYLWFADDARITGDSAELVLTQAHVGKRISVELSYEDEFGRFDILYSDPTSAVENVDDEATATVELSGVAQRGGNLRGALLFLNDIDGDVESTTWAWQVSDTGVSGWVDIEGASERDYIIPSDQSQVGKYLRFVATTTDPAGGVTSFVSEASQQVVPINHFVTGEAFIEGQAKVGQTLKFNSEQISDSDGLGELSYVWYSGNAAIELPSSNSYTITDADIGKTIAAFALYQDQSGFINLVRGGVTDVVIGLDREATGTVTVSGNLNEGSELLAQVTDLADADGDVVSTTWQWQVSATGGSGWVEIDGATSDRFVLPSDSSLLGKYIRAVAITQDSLGGTTVFEGLASEPVAAMGQEVSPDSEATGTLVISGITREGETLTAQLSDVIDPDGATTSSWQWQRSSTGVSDWVDIAGATGQTYTVAADQSEVGNFIRVLVVTTDELGGVTTLVAMPPEQRIEKVGNYPTITNRIVNDNDLPIGSVWIEGHAEVGQTLTAIAALTDADGLGPLTYIWSADGRTIVTDTDESYTVREIDLGKSIQVTVNYIDAYFTFEEMAGFATPRVIGQNAKQPWELTVGGEVAEGRTIEASLTGVTLPEDVTSPSWQWQLSDNGSDWTNIRDATSQSYQIAADQSEVGKYLRVMATTNDPTSGTVAYIGGNSKISNIDDQASATLIVSGSVQEGSELSAILTDIVDSDGDVTVSWLWQSSADQVSWTDIKSGLDATYAIAEDQSEVGKYLRVVATTTDALGGRTVFEGSATAAIANVNDLPTGSVVIGGTAEQGRTLEASHTLADADGLGEVSYQWLADDEVISGATSSNYSLTQSQVGKAITVRVSYTDDQGTPESVTSLATTVVANVDDEATGTLTVSGTAAEGQTLESSLTEVSDLDGATSISWQWQISDDGQSGWTDITGASNASYAIADDQSEVGKYLRVVATTTDALGGRTVFEGSATAAIANVNDLPTGSVVIIGTVEQGQILQASDSLSDADGLGEVTYQWLADGKAIEGATGSNYQLSSRDIGKSIGLQALYLDGAGTSEAVLSAPTQTVVRDPDTVTLTSRKEDVDAIGLPSSTGSVVVRIDDINLTVNKGSTIEFQDGPVSLLTLLNEFDPIDAFISVVNGKSQYVLPDLFVGLPELNLKYQLIDQTKNAVVTGSKFNDFIKLANSDSTGKAVDAGDGDDVIDGGVGSTFITGGGGSNTFFLDGRAEGVSWSTITDFKLGTDKATIWGWKAGVSKVAQIDEGGGAPGYEGVTLHFENLLPSDAVEGQINESWNSITFTGLSLSDFRAGSVDELNAQIANGTNPVFMTGVSVDEYGSHGYLYVS